MPIYSEVKELTISSIAFAPGNPRKSASSEAMKELASSIANVGVIHPVTVYRLEKGGYELIAGERRLRAAKLAKRETIPARELLNATPEIISEIRLIENCQREGVSPLEEGEAFRDFGQPAEEIALRIGKSLRYVYDRLNLLRLAPEPSALLQSGVLSLSHALILCKLTEKEQEAIMPDVVHRSGEVILGVIGVNELRLRALRRATASLAQARFDLNDRRLCPAAGACRNCSKRSGYNRNLFHDIEAEDVCFDPACFDEKTHAYCLSLEAKLKEQGYEVIRLTGLLLNTEYAANHELKKSYDFNCRPLEEAERTAKGQQKVAGVFFENTTKYKTGLAVAILPAEQERTLDLKEKGQQQEQQEDAKRKSALEQIKEEKAKKAFTNALLAGLGEAIGKNAGAPLNIPTLRLLGLYAFASMPGDMQREFARFYKWEEQASALAGGAGKSILDAENGDKLLFQSATAGLSAVDCTEIMLSCLLYASVLSAFPDKTEMGLVFDIARAWGFSPEAMKAQVEEDFGVKLKAF